MSGKQFGQRILTAGMRGFLILLLAAGCSKSSEDRPLSVLPGDPVSVSSSGISTISGKVEFSGLNAVNKSGILVTAFRLDRDQKAKARAKGTVQISEGVYQTTTDSAGYFELEVPVGEYNVLVEGPNAKKALRSVKAFAPTVNVDFILTATGSIKGRLVFEGKPIGFNADVFIPGTSFLAVTDKEGNFTISDVPVGSYLLQTHGSSSFDSEGPMTFPVTVKVGTNNIGDIDVALKPTVWFTDPANGGTTSRIGLFECEFCLPDQQLQPEPFAIHINFSHPMDPSSVQKATTITTPGNVPIKWNYNYPTYFWDFSVTISPASAEELLKLPVGSYTVSIGTAAVTTEGEPLSKAVSFSFTLDERVIGTQPFDGERDAHLSLGDGIGIGFSNRMNRASVQLTVTPPVPGMEIQWEDIAPGQEDGDFFPASVLNITGLFADNVAYTVTVSAGKTADGTVLSNLPFTFKVTTAEPKVVSVTPENGATEVQKSADVTINFNTTMDRDVVAAGVAVSDGANPVTGVSLKWRGPCSWGDYWGNCWDFQPGDRLEINFLKSYGKTYTISLTGMKTPEGTPLANFTSTLTVLSPRIVQTEPPNNGTLEPWQWIRLIANAPIDPSTVNTTNIQLLDISVPEQPIPVPIRLELTGIESGSTWDSECQCYQTPFSDVGRVIWIEPEGLKASHLYQVVATGLKAEDDGTPFPNHSLKFATERRRIVSSDPFSGAVDVPLEHRVTIEFNDRFSADEQAVIQQAVRITAIQKDGGVAHPAPAFLWGTWGAGYSRLFVNFTFDPATNYKVWASDASGNPTKEVKNSTGATVLFIDRYLEFTTLDPAELPSELPNLVLEVRPPNGSLDLDPSWLTVEVVFGTQIQTGTLNLEISEGTTLIPSDQYSVSFTTEWKYFSIPCPWNPTNCTTSDSRRVTVARVDNLPLKFEKSYTVKVLAATPRTDCQWYWDYCGETINNLPFTSTFTTGKPHLSVWVDNAIGKIWISTSGPAFIDAAALKTALSTTPSVTCTWDFDSIDTDPATAVIEPPTHVQSATCNYIPIVYANIKVEVGQLTAFTQVVDQTTQAVSFTAIGNFANTPLSEVFNINPDITFPVLEDVEVLDNSPGTEATLHLNFNEFLEASTVIPGNFTLTDNATPQNTLTIKTVQSVTDQHQPIEGNRWAGPAIHLTTDPLQPGVTYTLTVTGVKEFGGHYTIDTALAGTKTFTFNGKVQAASAIYTSLKYDSLLGKYVYTMKVAISFNVTMKADDPATGYKVADQIVVAAAGYWDWGCQCHPPGTPLENVTMAWTDNNNRSTLIIDGELGDMWSGRILVQVKAGALNSAGNKLDNTPFEESVYAERASLNTGCCPAVSVSGGTIQIRLSYSSTVEAASATDPLNYTVQEVTCCYTDIGAPLNVVGASLDPGTTPYCCTGQTITLTLDSTTPLKASTNYRLIVKNVRKQSLSAFPAELLGEVLNTILWSP